MKIKDIVRLIVEKNYLGAAAKIREDNVLPAITGRVCPQEDQCEGACLMGKKVSPLAIGYLERFIADWEADTNSLGIPPIAPATGRKVAIVGSGRRRSLVLVISSKKAITYMFSKRFTN
jgi:glutamate synthase (NADPH/NADH) small chain